ncbi:MAG: UpxY family transcription antiterminator [Bacteroidota bacterium]|nr:UpxY family transcription antiterminator [Bacteroidota bacterium]
MTKNNHWYALYTKSRTEKKVVQEIEEMGYIGYVPLITKIKKWSDREKRVEEPLIKSYVFVKANKSERYKIIKQITGAVMYITFEGEAAPIPEWQINSLRKIVENKTPFNLSSEKLKPGQHVTIKEGQFKDCQGEMIRVKGNKKFVVRLDAVGFELTIDYSEIC